MVNGQMNYEDDNEQFGKLLYAGIINEENYKEFCKRCLTKTIFVSVHGHLQCEKCKSVVHDCCSGENNIL